MMKTNYAHSDYGKNQALRARMATQVQENLHNLSNAFEIMNAIGTKIKDDDDLAQRMAWIDVLYNASDDLNSLPVRMAEMITDRVYDYESETAKMPAVPAGEALDYLIDVRDLKQSDLSDVATQSTVSAIISGKRKITLDQVKGFAKFFNVPESMFLG
jgi:HTH-type transcriptional regulator / antitoxin HigA